MAEFAHARAAGAWLSASPRVQRLLAAFVAVVLGASMTAAVTHRAPSSPSAPLELAAALGPTAASVSAARPPAVRHPVTAHPKAHAKASPTKGWAYWSKRIRGCESHGRPDASPDYSAKNPTSSASGAYQILDTTWAGRYGVIHASDAAPAQQEAAAAELYRQHGTADWAASVPCWHRR